jgi:hypothetical protein
LEYRKKTNFWQYIGPKHVVFYQKFISFLSSKIHSILNWNFLLCSWHIYLAAYFLAKFLLISYLFWKFQEMSSLVLGWKGEFSQMTGLHGSLHVQICHGQECKAWTTTHRHPAMRHTAFLCVRREQASNRWYLRIMVTDLQCRQEYLNKTIVQGRKSFHFRTETIYWRPFLQTNTSIPDPYDHTKHRTGPWWIQVPHHWHQITVQNIAKAWFGGHYIHMTR